MALQTEPLSASFQGWETVPSLKSLLHKLEDLRLTLSTPVKMPRVVVSYLIPELGRKLEDRWGCWSATRVLMVSSRARRHYSQRRQTMFPVTLRAVLCPRSREHTQNMNTHRFQKNHFDITHKILQLHLYQYMMFYLY